MFSFAIIIGIYSYCLFFLGIFGWLYPQTIISFTQAFLVAVFIFFRKELFLVMLNLFQHDKKSRSRSRNKFGMTMLVGILLLLFLQAIVNLIGALGPELAFDALWYHLTLPKLYLLNHAVYHIPGGLLYYSDMPKLGEMLYTGALSFGNEVLAKVFHFSFGILICLALYNFSRKYFSAVISLIAVIIFYSNLVVAWESITAYIDLIRTFYELLALWSFLNWWKTEKNKWLIVSALMIGFAIATKLLAFGSLVIFLIFIISKYLPKREFREMLLHSLRYVFFAVLVPLPWFIFSYLHTGNPVYPFFTHTYAIAPTVSNPFQFLVSLWELFTKSSDPISPVYLLFSPLLFLAFKKLSNEIQLVAWYCLLSLIIWYFTPHTGGGRFILPYLPAFSLVCAAVLEIVSKDKKQFGKFLYRFLVGIVIFVSLSSIVYRGVANKRYVPVILGYESKQVFLTNHLNFSFGDFYDTDNYFQNHIKSDEKVLLYGFHNLYYVDFQFIDSSWVKAGDTFAYIATQKSQLPDRFKNWQLIYTNDKSLVKLYKAPASANCSKRCIY